MVVGVAISTTTKRWFIILLLAHALRDPQFDDGFRKKWLSSNTFAHLLCTHYDITVQDLKFDGNTLLEVTSDLNKEKLSSAGIVDINQEAFSANESGIFSIRSMSSMGGSQKFFYLKSVDSIKRATESELVPVGFIISRYTISLFFDFVAFMLELINERSLKVYKFSYIYYILRNFYLRDFEIWTSLYSYSVLEK